MQLSIKKSPNGMHVLYLPETEALRFIEKGEKRVLAILNNKVELHCALVREKAAGFCIMISARVMKELGVRSGDTVRVHLQSDQSPLQFSVPEELQEVLNTDEGAKNVFDTLTDGRKRGLAALVLQVKSTDKRIERSLVIAEKLKLGITAPAKVLAKV
jgi:antitoxin component of MazEF toxin-antitoxin module